MAKPSDVLWVCFTDDGRYYLPTPNKEHAEDYARGGMRSRAEVKLCKYELCNGHQPKGQDDGETK